MNPETELEGQQYDNTLCAQNCEILNYPQPLTPDGVASLTSNEVASLTQIIYVSVPTPIHVPIPIQQNNFYQMEAQHDRTWHELAASGNGNSESIQQFINMGYNVDKYVKYRWKNKILTRPAIDIAIFTGNYLYAILLAMYNCYVSVNTLVIAHINIQKARLSGNPKYFEFNGYEFEEILTFYSSNYIDFVRKMNPFKKEDVQFMREKIAEYNFNRSNFFNRIENLFYEYINSTLIHQTECRMRNGLFSDNTQVTPPFIDNRQQSFDSNSYVENNCYQVDGSNSMQMNFSDC